MSDNFERGMRLLNNSRYGKVETNMEMTIHTRLYLNYHAKELSRWCSQATIEELSAVERMDKDWCELFDKYKKGEVLSLYLDKFLDEKELRNDFSYKGELIREPRYKILDHLIAIWDEQLTTYNDEKYLMKNI